MSLDLRPLSIPELLDRAFTLFRRHFVLFVGIMAVPSAFALAFSLFTNVMSYGPPVEAEETLLQSATVAAGLAVGMVLGVLVYWMVYMLALGATAIAVSDLYLGRAATIRSAYARVRERWPRLAMLSLHFALRLGGATAVPLVFAGGVIGVLGDANPLFSGLLFLVAALLAFALFVFLALRYALSVPAVVLEPVTAGESIRRSVTLSKGNLGRLFLIGACATILTYAGAIILQVPFLIGVAMAEPGTTAALVWLTAATVFGTIGSTVTAPVMIIGLAVLYFDARIRKEALDLQLMMGALPAVAAPLAPSHPANS